ncbi:MULTISPECIES: HAMP domain-containing sensor histidine kinase [unclassified Nonomuraea]|uniref:sensor histidine kinase n=1 Tax=unclassified Nonomuraea TaxID=2593643 RepID=UPI00340D6004
MQAQQRQFVTDASHELRTPLAGLRLRLEEARMYPGQIDLCELIHHTLREVDRIQDIVSDLLTLARLDAGVGDAPVFIDMAGFIVDEVGKRTDGLPIHLNLEQGLIVGGTIGGLARLLGNLLDNAQRHGRTAVWVTVSGEKGEVVVTVDDDGPGIPAEERDRVFDHFSRTDSARGRELGGAGLGLAIAQGIARAHHGTLTARASDRGGAQLMLRLPCLNSAG